MIAGNTQLSFKQLKQLTSSFPPAEDLMIAALTTQEGWQLLGEYPCPPSVESPDIVKHLRKHYPVSLVSSLQTQWKLREKAQEKLGEVALTKLFTRDGLEQATRQTVARARARRFATAGVTRIMDLGCGIGSDSMELASLCQDFVAVDISPAAATCAAINLCEVPSAKVLCESAENITSYKTLPALFVDPARRTAKGRVLSPNSWSPSLRKVLEWGKQAPNLAVKMAPGIDLSYLPDGYHAQWVSIDGDLVECTLYSAGLAPEGTGRSALIIHGNQVETYRCAAAHNPGEKHLQVPPATTLGNFFFELDPAIIRAGILSQLCERIGAAPVATGIAYLTGNSLPSKSDSFALNCYQIVDNLPLKAKVLTSYLRSQQATRLDVIKRGVALDIATWRKKIMPKRNRDWQPHTLTVALTRVGDAHRCLVLKAVQ
ncbi:class I SAM-dependent methyltransferase [Varibaculum vaginae]|uniref:class I SAM-dependent methyltransferase n=1 Tax=Varibaculum vaginae TaxID=2364797 RepID=UPI00135A8F64|nr:class I SAM-dependent methyltransferase [Varibaculum vaginae]